MSRIDRDNASRRAVHTGKVRDWHNPHNDKCPHNRSIECDCACKREVKRKGYTVRRVHDDNVPHGYKSDIVVEIWPNGVLKLRERGRKQSSAVSFMVGDLYVDGVRSRALTALRAKQKARAERRKAKGGKRGRK
jgi:hypothetical protein